jgi:hypothetical protein
MAIFTKLEVLLKTSEPLYLKVFPPLKSSSIKTQKMKNLLNIPEEKLYFSTQTLFHNLGEPSKEELVPCLFDNCKICSAKTLTRNKTRLFRTLNLFYVGILNSPNVQIIAFTDIERNRMEAAFLAYGIEKKTKPFAINNNAWLYFKENNRQVPAIQELAPASDQLIENYYKQTPLHKLFKEYSLSDIDILKKHGLF